MLSEDAGCGFCVDVDDVHFVCVDPATTPEVDIAGCAFGRECARKMVRKLLRNGLWVGMVVCTPDEVLHVCCCPRSPGLCFHYPLELPSIWVARAVQSTRWLWKILRSTLSVRFLPARFRFSFLTIRWFFVEQIFGLVCKRICLTVESNRDNYFYGKSPGSGPPPKVTDQSRGASPEDPLLLQTTRDSGGQNSSPGASSRRAETKDDGVGLSFELHAVLTTTIPCLHHPRAAGSRS